MPFYQIGAPRLPLALTGQAGRFTCTGCMSGLGDAGQTATTGLTGLLSIAAPLGLGLLGAKWAGKGGATFGFLAGAAAGVYIMLKLTGRVMENV